MLLSGESTGPGEQQCDPEKQEHGRDEAATRAGPALGATLDKQRQSPGQEEAPAVTGGAVTSDK